MNSSTQPSGDSKPFATTTLQPPQVHSLPTLPAWEWGDWSSLKAVFAQAATLQLAQSWLEVSEPRFAPATIKLGCQGDHLLIWATLTDHDIITAATHDHEPLWSLGDTLEIFLQPPGQETYYELHVAPPNHTLQLKWTDEALIHKLRGGEPSAWRKYRVLDEQLMKTLTRLEPENNQWQVLVAVDIEALMDDHVPAERPHWKISISRYDYSRGSEWPEHSSSSPHPNLDFHSLAEWKLFERTSA